MTAKLTILAHKIALQLHLMAESSIICIWIHPRTRLKNSENHNFHYSALETSNNILHILLYDALMPDAFSVHFIYPITSSRVRSLRRPSETWKFVLS